MKLVLDAQQDFIKQSAANEPSFAASKKDGEFQLNFQFGDFVTKLKEIASSFKNNVSDGPLVKALSANPGTVDDSNFLSGFLEGLGLENLAGKYEENRGIERQKQEYVQKFMDENPAAQILSPETAMAAAEENFRMLREGTMPQGTQTVQPMDKETALEQGETVKQQVELDKQLVSDVAELKLVSETNLPFLKEIRDISEDMLLQLQIIAQNAGGGGGFLPGGGGADKKPKPGGGKGRVGKILEKSKGLFQGMGAGFANLAAPLTVGMAGYSIYSNEQAVDAGTMTREEATKENTKEVVGTGAGLATAKAAAAASLPFAPMAGPAAPLVPIVAGIAGFFLGDAAARLVTDSIMSQPNDGSMDLSGSMESMDPESAIFAAPLSSSVPATSASNQLNKQTAAGKVEVQQTTQNNVSSPTTVINNSIRGDKSPKNDEPTFDRYTQQRAYP